MKRITTDDFQQKKNTQVKNMNINTENDKITVKYASNDDIFESPWARMKPFLLSKGRHTITNIYDNNTTIVKRVQTDGIITSEEIQWNNMGDALGQLRYEGYCQEVEIINVNEIRGEFKI